MKLLSSARSAFGGLLAAALAFGRTAAAPHNPWGFFLGQHKNPEANRRRKLKRQIGARQFRIKLKAQRRAERFE